MLCKTFEIDPIIDGWELMEWKDVANELRWYITVQ